MSAPRKWFQANVKQIIDLYGVEHAIQRDDLMLSELSMTLLIFGVDVFSVIGTLDTPDHAMFVSHMPRDGQVCLAFRN